MGLEATLTPGHDRRAIDLFLRWDRVGTVAGLVIVVVANLVLGSALLWAVATALVVLAGALTAARRLLDDGGLLGPLGLAAAGNWLVALVVALALPFLWPVMAITVLMPLVLASPHLTRRRLGMALGGAVVVAGAVCAVGLLNDDDGALPDIADELELPLVVGALMAQIAPIGLIVWQNNRLQRENLDRAAALNAELQRSQERLAASRRRIVQAADTERRRIERDLHDGAQQRLVALGVRLRLLQSQSGDQPALNGQLATLVTELDEAIDEVRELARGIYPPLLQSRGLVDAISAVARRSPLDVTVDLDDVGRLDQSVETAVYFTALEALTNAAKHAPGSSVELVLRDHGDRIRLQVTDDGPGFEVDDDLGTEGTSNMGDRVASVGGELLIASSPGAGTTVTAEVPRP